MPQVRFSDADDERLIELISNHAFLWDTNDPNYKNAAKKVGTWTKIGRVVNKSRVDCQKRWKSIRDHYKRQRREECTGMESAVKKKRALYWDSLNFLDSIDTEDTATTLIPKVELREATPEMEVPIVESPPEPASQHHTIKKMMQQQYKPQQCEDDEVDLLFRTMAMTVKKFRPELIAQTKLKLFQIVTEMEMLNHQT